MNTDEPVFSYIESTTAIHCDGTFRTSPRNFLQLLFLFFEYRDVIFPFGVVWMSNKSGVLYNAAFSTLGEHLPPNCRPQHIVCDYEAALRNGLNMIFPEVVPDRCYFHWAQAVYKNISSRGLTVAFRSNRRFKRWCLMTMALPLLPSDKIPEAWSSLQQEQVASLSAYEKRQWEELKRYIDDYWLHTIGPDIISVAFAPRRTNNDVERFNKGLNQKARVAHPPVFSITSVICNELDNTARDIISMDNGHPVREDSRNMFAVREAQLLRHQRAVRRGQLHPSDFLCKVAKVNKKYLLMMHQAMQHHARRLGEEATPGEESATYTSSSDEEEPPSTQPVPQATREVAEARGSSSQPVASPAVTRSRARVQQAQV